MTRLALALALCAVSGVAVAQPIPPCHSLLRDGYICMDTQTGDPTDQVEWLSNHGDGPYSWGLRIPLYTSPDGDDSNNATKECPVRTDERVLEICRAAFCGVVRLPASERRPECEPTS